MEKLEKYFDTAFGAPDGVKKFRELLLTIAMQGKLVPQNLKEGTAKEVLNELENQKIKLLKQGKTRETHPFPKIKESELPHAIPESWEWIRLGTISDFINGDRGKNYPNKHEYQNSGVPWINTGHIVPNGTLTQNEMYYISRKKFESLNGGKIIKGDIVYCLRGATFGKTAIVDPYDEGAIASSLVIIRPSSYIFNRFLYYYLISPVGRKQIFKYDNGSAQPNLSANSVKLFALPFPPFSEQKRIVTKIEELMSRCDELEKLRAERDQKRLAVHTAAIRQMLDAPDQETFDDAWQFITRHFGDLYTVRENVAELRKAILQLAVMGKLVKQDPKEGTARELMEEIEREKKRMMKEGMMKGTKPQPPLKSEEIRFKVPKGWQWIRLGDIVSLLGDGIHGTPSYDSHGEFYFINGNNLTDGIIEIKENTKRVSYSEFTKHKKDLNERSVFVSINGTIGNVAFYKNEKVILGKSACYFNLYNSINKQYIKRVFNSNYFFKYALSSATGTTIQNVSLKAMREFPIPLPPLNEQRRIEEKINQLMSLCDHADNHINTLRNKQGEVLGAVMGYVI